MSLLLLLLLTIITGASHAHLKVSANAVTPAPLSIIAAGHGPRMTPSNGPVTQLTADATFRLKLRCTRSLP